MKVLVLGGGSSGMAAAIKAAKNGHDVTILEKNKNLGKKLLITGNGRCNYFNSDFNYTKYYTEDFETLKKIINDTNKNKALEFFDLIGIIPSIKEGYYYPFSNSATSFNEALINTIKALNIKVITEANITDIEYSNGFTVHYNDKKISSDKVILSMGSKCYPKTGSSGDSYKLLKKIGHSITKIYPALTYLKTDDKLCKTCFGVRCNVSVSLDEKLEEGQLQINKDNISGICIFNLSGSAIKSLESNKRVDININFLHGLGVTSLGVTNNNFDKFINDILNKTEKRSVSSLLEGFLDYKLVNFILDKLNISKDINFNLLSDKKRKELSLLLTNYSVSISGYGDFDKCQTCMGGVPLTEINSNTMESNIVKGLYITGEVLEPYGICGGYNLGFSFITGILAGDLID